MTLQLHHGDCLEVMRTLGDCSVDAVVTDPPYGLAFMGKRWDYDVPSVEIWAECLRVLKPGGHLLAFAGTRTQHRMAVRIEDAGFEIRDMIAWVYGSGFPKSLDVSKAIDKRGGNAHLTAEIGAALKAARKSRGITATEADRTYCDGVTLWSWYEGRPAGQQMPTAEVMARVAADWPELQRYADLIAEAEREVVGRKRTGDPVSWYAESARRDGVVEITVPATPEAQQWAGWGTALKPALEPITMARKPLTGTVAANVLEHGTGALNVDGCRVGAEARPVMVRTETVVPATAMSGQSTGATSSGEITTAGRWPANLIHDGSDEAVGLFPQTVGKIGMVGNTGGNNRIYGKLGRQEDRQPGTTDTGSAARFFYTAKASKDDRDDGNTHPTVKPTDLMRYLCRLVTPPGGVVLDPFMGSGSTGKAALLEGFGFIGIEREAAYHAIAERRIRQAAAAGHQPSLALA
jgi:DNA modification methylase/transcriptional regulator with XRE-family HTH domain